METSAAANEAQDPQSALKTIRKARGWRYARTFAQSIGVNCATYSSHESGRYLTLDYAWRYADALNVTIDQIVGRLPFDPDNPDKDPNELLEEKRNELMLSYEELDSHGKNCLITVAKALANNKDSSKALDK